MIEILGISDTAGKLSWSRIRNNVHYKIDSLFQGETRALAKALLTGYKRDLEAGEKKRFARSGLSHIMAVSGLHVGFIIVPFWFALPWFIQFPYGKITGTILLTGILFGFAGLTGFSPSVNRASLMCWLFTTGRLFHQVRDSVNLLGVSALLLLLYNPLEIYRIGFQLSFAAVSVILFVLPVLNSVIPDNYKTGVRGRLFMVTLISFIAQLGLYPLLSFYFHEYSLIGPIANSLVIPVLAWAIPCSLLLIPLYELWPTGVLWLNLPNQFSFQYIQMIAEILGEWESSWIEAPFTNSWVFLIWIIAIGTIAAARIAALRWKLLAGLLLVIVFHQTQQLTVKLQPAKLKVVLLNVGQGDAIFVRTPSGKNIMIDTGRWSPTRNSGDQVLLPYLEHIGVKQLHAIVLTHPHADHLGGMTSLIEHVQIDTIYQNGYPYLSELFKNFRIESTRSQIPVRTVQHGDILSMDASIRIFVLGPLKFSGSPRSPNDHSIVLKIVYNETSWLFSGDAEKDQEERIVDRYGEFLRSDFLKVAHHGSHTSSHTEFLKTVAPSIAAGSLAFRNAYGHPHPKTVRRLKQNTDRLYFTSLDGVLVFESNGKKISKKE